MRHPALISKMDALTIAGLALLVVTPFVFVTMAIVEVRRLRRFLREGVRTEGEVISEELHGIKYRAPYPIVRFHDGTGAVRQFRSSISRRSRGFIHPEKVPVIYLPSRPEVAELFSGFHPYKHILAMGCLVVLSAAILAFALPMFFE